MFIWNLMKCLEIFDEVYVSSDSPAILNMARVHGAKTILRGDDLCGDVPDIPVYRHAVIHMGDLAGIVAVHADTPNTDKNLIVLAKRLIEGGVPEIMTCHPVWHTPQYKQQNSRIYGSVRGMSLDRLMTYHDPYRPEPEVLLLDTAIDIEDTDSYQQALCQRQS